MEWTPEQRQQAEQAARRGNMELANEILGTHGVEYVGVPEQAMRGRELAYCNAGDTYDTTLCKEGNEVWWGSWGSWLEAAEQEYEEDTGERRCPNCGEWSEQFSEESECPYCDYTD